MLSSCVTIVNQQWASNVYNAESSSRPAYPLASRSEEVDTGHGQFSLPLEVKTSDELHPGSSMPLSTITARGMVPLPNI